MTAPTPPDGAFTIGGGDFNFGQGYTDTIVRSLFMPPIPNGANSFDLLGQQLAKLPLEVLQFFKDIIPDPVEEMFETIEGAIDQILGAFSDNPLTKVVQDVQDVIDGMVNGLVGWVNTGYTPAQLKEIAEDVSKAISDLKTIVNALIGQSGYAGVAVVVDFSSAADASTLGSAWNQWYWGSGTSTLSIAGGRAKVTGSGSNRGAWARYTQEVTKTDYQKIGVVFGTKPSMGLLGGSQSKNRIFGRCDSGSSTFVSVEFTANSWILGCQVSGAWTTFAQSSFGSFTFKPGAVYWLELGTLGGPRIFRVWENNKVLVTYVDAANTSVLPSEQGAPETFRFTGVSTFQYSDNYKPAEIASFAFFDNNPAAVQGCGWRISRTSSSTANVDSGDRVFPASWFGTIDYATSDLEITLSANEVKVPATGWYQITIKQHGDGALIGGYSVQPALIVNNYVVSRGQNSYWNGYNTGFSHSFTVYLNANDRVKPGYWASAAAISQLGGGDAAGQNTWWSGVFLGNNKKPPTT